MQEIRDYLSVLCEFLQDKGPILKELQEAMQRLHEECANALMERRAADNANELTEVKAAVNAAKQHLPGRQALPLQQLQLHLLSKMEPVPSQSLMSLDVM
jgi:hypothetical protein